MIPAIDYTFVHPAFMLNGFYFSKEDLSRVAYAYIKEGSDFEQQMGRFLLDWFDANNYIVMHTSGTTGKPKEIRVSKQAMVHSALATGRFFDLPARTKALLCLPLHYIAGKMMMVRALVLGWELDVVPPSSDPLQGIKTGYDFAALVPLQAEESIQQLYKIKQVILGGAKVNAALAEKLGSLPTAVYETYGMTETVSHIAVKRVGEAAFTVLPDVAITTDDRQCLVIDTPKLSEKLLITNDVVDVIDESHFEWKGRFDNVINSGGIKLFPEQIEEKLAPHIARRFFVAGVADDRLGNRLVLVIEGKPYDIDETIFSSLGKFEKPREVIFREQFAETASGKVIRHKSLDAAL
ncbi:AMP-binding protein [Flavobacterium rhizosphaerae]|uniref:AMP-binding protein n=1 Tax=Flavobacterium rhizosphaerae TaxID=3163298 RepID=A0ABW8YVX0_9FLAO